MNFYYLSSCQTLYSSLLVDLIEKSSCMNIVSLSFDELSTMEESNDDVFIILDLKNQTDKKYKHYLSIISQKKFNFKEILFNVISSNISKDIMKYPNVVGAFYETDNIDVISQGVRKIMDGEIWLSREITKEIIFSYREKQNGILATSVSLTGREKEILKLLSLGASNIDIATELYVSENTVKTHLYNIFRKLNVKNRLQAMMWAKGFDFKEDFL
ncbi:LuxR C-terminal-related transcriptional regulator [Aliivibrio sp. S4TY2]|uniref:LuxR C-terminal-related transcriptional regulator n=1 Tax=unclassified Aliivibrio TaxID=2645654 RepID=UPI002378515C|nr:MULTISPECIES: LuxR C-terminal-related transcriptional regulator [unclassified Aliivibrio]MDD9155282.1 LuxR C-terminal-related transcriptional regulator [Aliivibrio sp. S4TY2]MDD9159166.1 LuxR C-terminal-related transcriptional regulator [Aliivibrio sp. S4TY1]MDD9163284.1 LuxR C-terminal-related transcriptional regulator [Aliivibrio sp. S4MY2]MDD9167165.1 LuxR C-terminal-related transcriptional regulator [Aliivibrio sp. S4MY4]MDD9184361.1 LuxR C-terminal-related transcriptional regulator [Al